jgi:hypothetical protein
MAIFIDYTGDGVTTDFSFSFPYLQESHVILDIDGTQYDTSSTGGTTFTIESGPVVRVNTAPANGAVIRIYRNSRGLNNADLDALYDFTDGSVVTEDQLDGIYLHNLYLAQESTQEKINSIGAAAGSVLIYDATNKNWKVLPLNLQYDATNDTVGIGGAAATDYKHKLHGDLLVEQTGTANGAVVTIQNTDATNDDAVLILASQDPKVQHYDTNGSTDKKYFLTKYGDGTLTFIAQSDAGTEKTNIPLRLVENGSTILGGESSDGAIGGYTHTIYGDIIMQDDSTEATLTVQNTNAGEYAAVLRLIADAPTVVWNDDGGATDQKFLHAGFGTGSLDFTFYSDAGSPYAIPLQLTTDGSAAGVKLNALPTSDPAVAGQLWKSGGFIMEGSAPAALNTLTDVTITTPASGQFLKWNGSAFVNFTPTLQDLSNVASGTPNNLDILQYNAGSGEYEPMSRYAYDSGWITELASGGSPVTLAANAIGYETLSLDQATYFPFEVVIWGRSSSIPEDVYRIVSAVAQGSVTNTVGAHVRYETDTRNLFLFLQDLAVYHEASSGLANSLAWGFIDEIRITISR